MDERKCWINGQECEDGGNILYQAVLSRCKNCYVFLQRKEEVSTILADTFTDLFERINESFCEDCEEVKDLKKEVLDLKKEVEDLEKEVEDLENDRGSVKSISPNCKNCEFKNVIKEVKDVMGKL